MSSYSIPPRIIPDAWSSGRTLRFILSQYEPLFKSIFFRPAQVRTEDIQARFINQVVSSNITHWSMFVGAQMFRALRQDAEHPNVERFIPWLDRLDRLCLVSENDASLDDIVGRLNGALELSFLRYLSSSSKHGFTLIRQIAPTFMQVACADPTVWPRDPGSSGISLAHALVSPRYVLGRFIFVDVLTSLTFGVPPVVEYDTSHPIIPTIQAHPIEWVNGCPFEFVFSIARINQWRARRPDQRVGHDRILKEIEADTWAWQPRCDYGPETESWKVVMRHAVQEGWRHGVLIYLYMGMCGATSHDSRVQSAVRQISKLHTTVGSQGLAAGIHFNMPVLLAAIAARSEADRSKFGASLSKSGKRNGMLMSCVDFGLVLHHLWSGAGANGGPVVWDDYVDSMGTVADVTH
ncbi:Fungal specific transcription factor domain [Ceratobasidium sp. AG-Ba]|nr:Fungal specific transcription factor domain [Ceratobasidium sp. AG-Ba]